MNTTKTGDKFENRVFELIKDLLDKDEFVVSGKRSFIYQKREYYSELRKGNIICDISIETFLPNAKNYSILNIIECKYLNKNVSIDDIEEFDSKLTQIGKHNSKGILASNKGFSKSTINFAKSLKIGLLKIKNDNQTEWINYRKKYTNIDFENDTTESFLAKIGNKTVNNIADFLLELKVIDFYKHKEKFLKVPFLSIDYIESISHRLLKYEINNGLCLDTNKLCDFLASRYPIEFKRESIYPLLGKIEFNPLSIVIDNSLDEHRFRFTLCHEIGHLVLHQKLLSNKIDTREDDEYSLTLNSNISDLNTRRIEIQANIFASYLLMPTEQFQLEVMKFFVRERIQKNYIYLDRQPINQILVNTLITEISSTFNVSKESVKLRLIDAGLLKDAIRFSYKNLLENLKH